MKKSFLLFGLLFCVNAQADDRLRDVQTELKNQGFYYGEINGESTSETTAAIRRYQIRNGLEVTGTLTDETAKSLGSAGSSSPGVPLEAPAPAARAVAPKSTPPLEESDRKFLRREEAQQRPPAPPPAYPPPSAEPASSDLAEVFAGTPYASAPREVQAVTLQRVQAFLGSRRFYRGAPDSEAGPALEEAILSYQRSVRLPLTGRLDLETLSTMRLLPGRAPVPLKGFVRSPRDGDPRPVYRGIWVR